MAKTIAEKILARGAGRTDLKPGDIVWVQPDLMIANDINYPLNRKLLLSLNIDQIAAPDKLLITIDHHPYTDSRRITADFELMRQDSRKLGIRWFFDIGRGGISHIIPIEHGIVRPGMLVITSDSRSPSLGALGALGIAIGGGFLVPLAYGKCWLRVPTSIKVNVIGCQPEWVFSRDIGQWIASQIGPERGDYRIIEFAGEVIRAMGMDERHTLCNSMVDIGVKSAIIEADRKVVDFFKTFDSNSFSIISSDPDANYEAVLTYDISSLEPQICIPPSPELVRPVRELEGKPITQAFIGSCISGKMEDMRIGAKVLAGREVNPNVRLFIVPATQGVYIQSLKEGLLEIFTNAKAVVAAAACGLCFGSMAPLNDQDVCISTGTRNDPGRMGSPKATIYLASAATVAASAIEGKITDPRRLF